ncbi:hypothetical protein ABZ915_43540 [Streptomyces sp. NPDC046915]
MISSEFRIRTRCHRPDQAVDILERGRGGMLGEALARDRTDL